MSEGEECKTRTLNAKKEVGIAVLENASLITNLTLYKDRLRNLKMLEEEELSWIPVPLQLK